MRYVIARFKNEQRTLAYRIYISDSIYYYAQGRGLTSRWYDVAYPPKEIDNRTGDEIALDVIESAGLRFEE